MSTFWPTTPLQVAYALALLLVCGAAAYKDRALWPLIAVMVANWIGTRAVTAFELNGFQQGMIDLASAVTLMMLRHKRTMVFLPVSVLFLVMVNFSLAYGVRIISWDTLWAWSDVAAYAQLVIIAGSIAGGGGGRRVKPLLARSGRTSDVGVRVAHRRETETHT